MARNAEIWRSSRTFMKISGNEIRPGSVIEHEGSLWVAVKTQTVKPGKGPAYNQVELKNLIDGRKLNNRFGTDERVETAEIKRRDFQYLYREGDMLVFMGTDTYDQISLAEEFVGERTAFLQDGMMVTVQLHGDTPIGISLPLHVTLEVAEAEPTIKGQTAASSYKPALLENGVRVMVPPFVAAGERIVVDTSEVAYVRRAE
jgi:elongation factor P